MGTGLRKTFVSFLTGTGVAGTVGTHAEGDESWRLNK
jgi:hypothetical protein